MSECASLVAVVVDAGVRLLLVQPSKTLSVCVSVSPLPPPLTVCADVRAHRSDGLSVCVCTPFVTPCASASGLSPSSLPPHLSAPQQQQQRRQRHGIVAVASSRNHLLRTHAHSRQRVIRGEREEEPDREQCVC